jgi:hypothetical protein
MQMNAMVAAAMPPLMVPVPAAVKQHTGTAWLEQLQHAVVARALQTLHQLGA